MGTSRFLEMVANQIKSKEAKEYVKSELSQHIQQSKQSWVNRGYSEVEAEEKAVKEMGSALSLGKSLNKLYRPKVDWLLMALLVVVLLLSFLPILNLGPFLDTTNLKVSALVSNKVIAIFAGLIIAIGIMYMDYRKLKRFGYIFYAAGLGLVTVLCLFSNKMVNGEMMISLGVADIQLWMAIPIFLLGWAALFSTPSFKLWQGIVLYVFSCLLFLNMANLSMLFTYTVIVGVLFLVSKFSRKEKLLVVGSALLIGAGIIAYTIVSYISGHIEVYQISRLLAFIYPDQFASESGYIYVTLENAIKSAGWLGAENMQVIPDAHTNLVFGSLIQSYGYAIGLVVFIVLAAFLVRFLLISRSIKDPFGKMLVIGGVTLFATQFLYNVGMTFGLLPITSMSLPFMSYGLMPTVLNAFIVGIVLSVYRRKQFNQRKVDVQGNMVK